MATHDNTARGIVLILIGMLCISINDAIVKQLSGDYPLHQLMFIRSALGIVLVAVLVQAEGGWRLLFTKRPGMPVLRAFLVILSNLLFYTSLAVLPLTDATALFLTAPLFITLLAIPLLRECVGAGRLAAVTIGLLGMLLVVRPGDGPVEMQAALLLPILAAIVYACKDLLTRHMGASSSGSIMAFYIQATFVVVSAGFWLIAGDGRLAAGLGNESALFLLRPWVWPAGDDWPWLLLLGGLSAVISYTLAESYRSAEASTIAPFEYTAIPLAIVWGWLLFGEAPDIVASAGMALIAGAGVFVFMRERRPAPDTLARCSTAVPACRLQHKPFELPETLRNAG